MTAPATDLRAPTDVVARPHLLGGAIDLAWRNPPASAFTGGAAQVGVTVVRRERTFPLTPQDGTVVFTGTGPVVESYLDSGLTPLVRYYYTVFAYDGTGYHAGPGSSASALATAEGGLAERLYRMLPAVHQRDDLPLRADQVRALPADVQEALRALPPELRGAGQLRRFLAAAGAPLGLMRSTAEGLRQLHDIDRTPPDYLPLLAGFVDWRPDRTLPVFAQRNEVRIAPHWYRSVGTVPNLRAIVTHYTGWQTRIAEYAQHIARTHHPAQGNVYALRESAAGWRGVDDAADLLGFGPGNTDATGTPGAPATLTGTLTGPFALRPGMELTVGADGRPPVTARFSAAALADPSPAALAAVLGGQLPELLVTATPDGRLRLRSQTSGDGSALRIESGAASLVSLDGAPRSRLAVAATGPATFHLLYAVADPMGAVEEQAARRIAAGIAFPRPPAPGANPAPATEPGPWPVPAPASRLAYRVFRQGRFGDSYLPFPDATVPAGEPAAAVLPAAGPGDPARILLCWLDRPGTGSSSLRWAIGTVGSPAPAVLTGERSSPLPVPHRGLLVLRREYGPPRGVSFARTDFADPAAPTAAEVAALINLRGGGLCVADVTAGGRLRLTATAAGGDVQLTVDMRLSTVADALGFSADTGTAYGAWGDAVSWGQAQGVPAVADGWLADLVAVPDGAGARLAYARHDAVAWQVRTVRFDGTGWTADEALTSGTHSSREPALLREDTGRIIAVWAQQAAVAAARWSLRRRNRDPGTGAWDAEAVVTAAPVADAEGDRQPALALDPGGAVALYFRSDRGGGASLWQQPLAGGPASVIAPGPAADGWPAPVDVAGRRWLLYRSDRPVPHTRVGAGSAADLGTLRQYAGATTLVPAAVDRLNRRHAWDDLLAYTPCRPEGESAQQPLRDDELYTRGTVGLYLVQTVSGPLDEQMANRLRSVLQRFLPQNTRAVVWLAPTADVEVAYPPGADLIDSFLDKHPDIDHFGAPGEQVTVALPGWRLLLSARPATPPPADPAAGGTSADPAHPASLRARSYAPPPQ